MWARRVKAKSKTVPSAEMVAEETGFLAAAGLSVYDAYYFEQGIQEGHQASDRAGIFLQFNRFQA